MNKFLVKFIIKPIGYFYIASAVLSGAYFNWQYAKDNGFIKWIFLGEIVPTLQAVAWPYFSLQYLFAVEPPPDGQVIAEFKKSAWWLKDYKKLVTFKSDGTALSKLD